MAGDLIIGIDVGTTSVKAGVLDRAGNVLFSSARSYPTARPVAGHAEQDPHQWTTLVDQAIQGIVAQGFADRIAGIGLCSQVNTHVFVDGDGTPLLPAILWQDGRAQAEAQELDAQVSDEQKCAWWGGPMPIDASHALARMLWVARHHPEIWRKTRWVMLPKDYCLFRLTGRPGTDPLSNIGLVDSDLAYIPEVLALVPGAAARVLPLLAPMETAGPVVGVPELAEVPVVSGTMDAWAGLVGAGGARNATSVYLSGTSEILGISSGKVIPTPGVIVFPQSCGIRMHAAPTQSGGDANLWFSEVTGLDMTAMSQLVAATARSASTPMFLPQLQGERAPLWDAGLRAHFLGMSRRTGMGDMVRAVYEGVAFSARHALEALELSAGVGNDVLVCGGGGFQSSEWAQIRADVLGRTLRTLAFGETGILGAAALAGVGSGIYADLGQATDALVRFDRTYTPDPVAFATYSALFEIYKDAIAANADLITRISEAGQVS